MADEKPPATSHSSGPPPDERSDEGRWEVEAEADATEQGMNFLDHLEELRWTLAKCVAAFMAGCAAVLLGLTQIANLLRWPYDFAVRGRDATLFEGLISTSFMGVFSVVFQLMLIGGFALSLPFMLFFIGRFVAPGLKPSEIRMLLPGCVGATVLFIVGSTFSFFVLLPAGLRASIYFHDMLGFDLLVTASSYYSLLTWATLGVGLAFEFPLVLILLIHLGIVTPEKLIHYRRHSIVVFLVISALVTPTPDPITFLFLAIPLYLLYELSIWLGIRVRDRAERRRAEDVTDV